MVSIQQIGSASKRRELPAVSIAEVLGFATAAWPCSAYQPTNTNMSALASIVPAPILSHGSHRFAAPVSGATGNGQWPNPEEDFEKIPMRRDPGLDDIISNERLRADASGC